MSSPARLNKAKACVYIYIYIIRLHILIYRICSHEFMCHLSEHGRAVSTYVTICYYIIIEICVQYNYIVNGIIYISVSQHMLIYMYIYMPVLLYTVYSIIQTINIYNFR